jgi:protein SCO1
MTFIGLLLALLAGGTALFPCLVSAHTPQDQSLPNVGVDEKLGARIPPDLTFTDQDGKTVRLGDYFSGGPVILTLNYYSCPMLCPVLFRNLAAEITAIKGLSPEKDYRIVTVSIDPEETLARTKAKAVETWRMIPEIRDPSKRWPFLMGAEGPITELARATGLRYTRLGKNNFAHPSILVILTPQGKVARYLYGIEQRPSDLKLALVEAAGGKIGGSRFLNQVLLYCFHYDPVGKKYAVTAINLMKITGAAMLAMLGILLMVLWRKEKKGPHDGPEVR